MIGQDNTDPKPVHVLTGKLASQISDKELGRLVNRLPDSFHSQVYRYQKKEDIQASAIGKLLLLEGLKTFYGLGADVLNCIKYNKYNKPYLNGKDIAFNISHSSGLVLCAFSDTIKIGVDVEKVRPINIEEFSKVFTGQELHRIYHSTDQYLEFFTYWTKKEALLKAEGLGLRIPLTDISFNYAGDQAEVLSTLWFLNPLDVDHKYCGWVATDKQIGKDDIDIQSVPFVS